MKNCILCKGSKMGYEAFKKMMLERERKNKEKQDKE